jgi:hypothetical protein
MEQSYSLEAYCLSANQERDVSMPLSDCSVGCVQTYMNSVDIPETTP